MKKTPWLFTVRPRMYASIALFASLVLAGCGDGGNGPPPPPPSSNPVASNGCSYVELNGPLTTTLSGSDPSGRAITFELLDSASNGTVNLTNPLTGEFTYTPNTNARGTDSFSFRVSNGQASSNTATFRIVHTPRIMPLGDSITWGVTDSPGSTNNPPLGERVGYRKRLRDDLIAAGHRIDFVGTLKSGTDAGFLADDPEHEGHGAWRIDQLVNGNPSPLPGTGSEKLVNWLDATKPDVVLLHIGTNDLNASGDQSNQWPEVEQLLDVIDTWEASHWPVNVIVSLIINVSPNLGTPEHRAETSAFNTAVLQSVISPRLANGDQIAWVNHEATLSAAADYADLLHPSDSGYQKMARVWLYPLAGEGIVTGSHTGAGILPKCP